MRMIRLIPPSAQAKRNRCIDPLSRIVAYACIRLDSPPFAIPGLQLPGSTLRGEPKAVTLPRCFMGILRGLFLSLVLFFEIGGGGRFGVPFLGLQ